MIEAEVEMDRKEWLKEEYKIARSKSDYDRMQEISMELYEVYGYIT